MHISKIFSIFRKKQEPSQETSVDFRKARTFFVDKTKIQISEVNERRKLVKQNIQNNINNLEKLLNNFLKVEPEEEKAKASKGIKDTYVTRSLELIKRVRQEGDIEKGAKNFVTEFEKISPSQAMHLKFFFQDYMANIADNIKTIKNNLDELETINNEPFVRAKDRTEKLYEEIDLAEKNIAKSIAKQDEIKKEIEEAKDYIKKYTDKLSVLGSDEYIIHYEEIKAMQNEIDGLRHKVNEKMSPLTRVIKKYIYLQPDVLLFSYIENACEAVEHDSRFEIGEKLSTIKDFISAGKIEADEKEIAALNEILRNIHELEELRIAIISKKIEIDNKSKDVDDIYFPKHNEIDSLNRQIKELESKLENLETESAHENLNRKGYRQKINQKIREIESLMSDQLKQEIRIYEYA